MRIQHFIPLLLLAICFGISAQVTNTPTQTNTITTITPVAPPPIIKVAVFADGRITADGKPVTIDSLRKSFKALAAKKGAVWYYREAARREPPPQAMQVIKAVVDARLPIRLSSRPDYSDSIGFDGKPIQQ